LKVLLYGLLLCFVLSAWAQKPQYGPGLKTFLTNKKRAYNSSVTRQRTLEPIIVKALVNNNLHPSKGIKIRSRVGNVAFIEVEPWAIDSLLEHKEIRLLELNKKLSPTLFEARKAIKATEVQKGIGIPLPLNGEGVIVGVVDRGMDYTHPTFRDENGKIRIAAAWSMNSKVGTPPQGYDYGAELRTETQFFEAKTDAFPNESHGCHVSGIAVGTGFLSNEKYKGIAPKADLWYVGSDLSESQIIDGTKWIFGNASAQNKPAVVNYSFGGWAEPLDGTSLLDQAVDGLVGPGKIVVVAMGNEGGNNTTISKKLKANDTLNTVWQVPNYQFGITPVIDIWGEKGKHFKVILESNEGVVGGAQSVTLFNSRNGFESDSFAVKLGEVTDTFQVYVYPSYATNGCPRVLMFSSNKGKLANPTVRIIPEYNGKYILTAPFVGLGNGGYPNFTTGTNTSTLRTPASAKLVISVGSFEVRDSFQNLNGEIIKFGNDNVGKISRFSSRGPTFDGRVKPDLLAPGGSIFSSVSSYDSFVNFSSVQDTFRFEDRKYSYQAYSGTSMACPMVTGAIALILQNNPNLTPGLVKQILREAADTDEFTGEKGNNNYGWGKLNVLSTIFKSFEKDSLLSKQRSKYFIYPNPVGETLEIRSISKDSELIKLEITDALGRKVGNYDGYFLEQLSLQIPQLQGGYYFLKLTTKSESRLISFTKR
jgi:subtilisin family serine protease